MSSRSDDGRLSAVLIEASRVSPARLVAYYNDGKGHVHSGVFYYDDARGIMLASGSQAMHVLMLQPQMIEALGLPKPTDPAYPYE